MQNELLNAMQNPKAILQVTAADLKEIVCAVVEQTAGQFRAEYEQRQVPVTPSQAARYLGVSVTTLWRWDKEGYLAAHKIGGKSVYFLPELNAIKGIKQ